MKNLSIFSIFVLCLANLFAQQSGAQRIQIAPYISSNVKISNDAKSVLLNKMDVALTNNGISANPFNSRFILTANVVVLSKNVVASAPVMYSYELEVTFYLGDGVSGTKYCNLSRTVIGVSTSDARAYIEAFKKISISGNDFSNFIDLGKKKIIDYYNNMCNTIINESRMLTTRNEFSAAIYKLLSVPDACTECYEKCIAEVSIVYRKKINLECQQLLNEANNTWMSTISYEGAKNAGIILNKIDPNANCFGGAQKLRDEIKLRISKIDAREWDMRWETEVGLQRDAIKAARDIAVAYAENQPDLIIYSSTSYNLIGWW
jgi:hypothetical protein